MRYQVTASWTAGQFEWQGSVVRTWDAGSSTVIVDAANERSAQSAAHMVRTDKGFALQVPSGAKVTYAVKAI